MRPAIVAVAVTLASVLVSGCAPRRAPSPDPDLGRYRETGMASWYGHPYHGRRTASGEIYDMEALTAAHPTLPFGTVVEVTHLSSGHSVRVRINDRGPFRKGRIVDLSRAAARRLGMVEEGVARVRLVVVRGP